MTPERWQEIERIYQAALDSDPFGEVRVSGSELPGDSELRKEVVSLLEAAKESIPSWNRPLWNSQRARWPTKRSGQRVASPWLPMSSLPGLAQEVWVRSGELWTRTWAGR